METSRKQYQEDAKRYRTQYEEAEKQSDTLRMKLGNIEESFREMQEAQENVQRGLAAVREVLTDEQWQKLPERVRNLGQRRGSGGRRSPR